MKNILRTFKDEYSETLALLVVTIYFSLNIIIIIFYFKLLCN